jgi:hypothetical protein
MRLLPAVPVPLITAAFLPFGCGTTGPSEFSAAAAPDRPRAFTVDVR